VAGNSQVREFAGETREAAIASAARYFGVSEEELDYKAVEGSPVSGLGGRSLVIAAPRGQLQMRGDRPREGGRGDRGGRGRDRGDRDRGRSGDRDRGRGGRGRERGDRGSERGGRSSAGDRSDRGDRGGRDRDRGRAREESDRPLSPEEQELERMAQEAAQHVREDGEPQLLPAMNSKERWVVHNALKSEAGISSQSEGDGPMRRVKILPA
jgi:hypothetical protein